MSSTRPYNTPIPILYEDNHIIVVEKPVNLLSQADETGDPDLLTLLKDDIKQRYNKPGNVFLGLVHRLDRPVGGAMVLARTSKAASRLSDAVRTRDFHKRYVTVVQGQPKNQKGRLIDYLVKDAKTNTVRVCSPNTLHAKQAILDYQLIASDGDLSLLLIQLHTGRPHQIRVQLAHAGCPLYGDQRYGKKVSVGQQIALWSAMVGFDHPTLKQPMQFASLPPDVTPWNRWSVEQISELLTARTSLLQEEE